MSEKDNKKPNEFKTFSFGIKCFALGFSIATLIAVLVR